MTDTELLDDLGRLLREGLIAVETDTVDEHVIARFRPTARGLAYATSDEGVSDPWPVNRSRRSGARDASATVGRSLA